MRKKCSSMLLFTLTLLFSTLSVAVATPKKATGSGSQTTTAAASQSPSTTTSTPVGTFLFYAPFSSKSVKVGYFPLVEELAKKGHKVIIVTPFKAKKPTPGVTEIIHTSPFEALTVQLSETLLSEDRAETDLPLTAMLEASIEANRQALSHPELQRLLADPAAAAVDVVVGLPLMANEAGAWVAHQLNATLVDLVTAPFILPWMATNTGIPLNPATMPLAVFPYSQTMSFSQRLVNSVATAAILAGRKFFLLPKVDNLLAEVFPTESAVSPGVEDLAGNTALVINHGSPFTGDGLRPTLPNIVQAGLMSCSPGKPLEGELREWVEGAKHGVIYLSFGSVVKPAKMPVTRREMLIKVLGQLKQRIVWKWDVEMDNLPANIKTFSWLPQLDVLAHKKVKLFITHGGAGSIQETICHKTPIVGIPLATDQVNNCGEAEREHIGLVINWRDLNGDNLLASINKVLTDSSYQESVDRLQNLIMDAPLHPRDKAIWWLEYLLRHPHNPAMRSPAKDLNFAQYFLLDVICVLLAALGIVLYVIKKVAGLLCCKQKMKSKAE